MLADAAILAALVAGEIVVDPTPPPGDVGQCGIRVHLGESVLVPAGPRRVVLTGGENPEFTTVGITGDGFELVPGGFVLAATRETVQVGPSLLASIDGRSTVARLGVFVHCASAVLDNLTQAPRAVVMELYNAGQFSVVLRAGDPVAQLLFDSMDGGIVQADKAQYAGQLAARGPDVSFDTQGSRTHPELRHQPEDYECPFCEIVAEGRSGLTSPGDIVLRTPAVTAFIASHWWPNNPGNVVVATNSHYENLYDLPETLDGHIAGAVRRIALAMKRAYGCQGVSTRQHNEPAGGQDVWHFHSHVFPRYADDRLYELDPSKGLASPAEKRRLAEVLRDALSEQ